MALPGFGVEIIGDGSAATSEGSDWLDHRLVYEIRGGCRKPGGGGGKEWNRTRADGIPGGTRRACGAGGPRRRGLRDLSVSAGEDGRARRRRRAHQPALRRGDRVAG